jgi:hypothetical protein
MKDSNWFLAFTLIFPIVTALGSYWLSTRNTKKEIRRGERIELRIRLGDIWSLYWEVMFEYWTKDFRIKMLEEELENKTRERLEVLKEKRELVVGKAEMLKRMGAIKQRLLGCLEDITNYSKEKESKINQELLDEIKEMRTKIKSNGGAKEVLGAVEIRYHRVRNLL